MEYNKKEAGDWGEQRVRDRLSEFVDERFIYGFIRSKNLKFLDKNFQLDFLLFTPNIGLVLLEVKNWKGEILASSEKKWVQKTGRYTNKYNNPSLQSFRTVSLLMQLLEYNGMNKWPIRPLVVFTNNSVVKKSVSDRPQTDIVKETRIKEWIAKNSNNNYYFQKDDFFKILNLIKFYQTDYEPIYHFNDK